MCSVTLMQIDIDSRALEEAMRLSGARTKKDGSCNPQRVEFSRSVWRWIDSAQYRLLRHGAHRALSAVDLLICATAADRDLVVLHDDADFATASRWLPDVRDQSVFDLPAGA
jgi:predicted nucleic acid-binding protein